MHGYAARISKDQPKPRPIAGQRLTVVGFHLLVAFWVLNSFFPSQGLSLIKVGTSLVLLTAVLCFALQILNSSAKKDRGKFDHISKIVLGLLFVWCLVTFIRGFTATDTGRFFTLLANPEIGGLVWLLPFAVHLGRQPSALLALLPAFRWHAIVGIALVVWSIYEVALGGVSPKESAAKVGLLLLYAAPFVLLTGVGSRWDFWLYMPALALAAVANFYLGNRASLAMFLGVLLLSLALGRVRGGSSIVLRVAAFSLAVVVLAMLAADYAFPLLGDEWFVDTRSFLWKEMNDDFSTGDWLIGRGALGTYYSPYFEIVSRLGAEGDSPYRQVSEVGYLHVALKAGLVGVVLYFFVVLRAAFLSLRIQDKRFAVGLMVLLTLHLVEMAVVGQASFQPSQLLLWVLVGVALSRFKNQSSMDNS